MATDEFEGEEVDRLIHDLASRRKPPEPRPAVSAPAPATQQAAQPTSKPVTPTRGTSWTTARLLMPQMHATRPRKLFAFASALPFPALPRIPKIALPALSEAEWRVVTARLFVGLGVALSAAMPYWPYVNACSWGLGMYLSVVLLLLVTGIWATKLTWDARLGRSHTIAVAVVCWGLALAAATLLPRIGYAAAPAVWFCK